MTSRISCISMVLVIVRRRIENVQALSGERVSKNVPWRARSRQGNVDDLPGSTRTSTLIMSKSNASSAMVLLWPLQATRGNSTFLRGRAKPQE
jgi:hypothetical protein